jgi:HEPN domain-containing protein
MIAATRMLELNDEWLIDAICFHAQQSAKKYLKARLVYEGVHFPKIHDIGEILALLPAAVRPRLSRGERRQLADYAVVVRYPNEGEETTIGEAEAAVRLARRVRNKIRKSLPENYLSQAG